MMDPKKEFWISNISDKNVSLRDLAYSVPARKHVNLLSKGFSFTLEQLQESAKSGSLFAKRSMIKVRKVPPPEESPYFVQKEISKEPRYSATQPAFSRHKIVEPKFDELDTTETEFIDSLTDDIIENK